MIDIFITKQVKIIEDRLEKFKQGIISLNSLTNDISAAIHILNFDELQKNELLSIWWLLEEMNGYYLSTDKVLPHNDKQEVVAITLKVLNKIKDIAS